MINILFQENIPAERVFTGTSALLWFIILFCVAILTVILIDLEINPLLAGLLVSITVVLGGFLLNISCELTPPHTNYWVSSDDITQEQLAQYEIVDMKGKIYILTDKIEPEP